jgi:hypothetical protein
VAPLSKIWRRMEFMSRRSTGSQSGYFDDGLTTRVGTVKGDENWPSGFGLYVSRHSDFTCPPGLFA